MPKKLAEAVQRIIDDMNEKERVIISNILEEDVRKGPQCWYDVIRKTSGLYASSILGII